VAKRLTDIVLAAVGLLLSLPVIALAAVGIRLSSRGPVLYRGRLVGRDGVCFTMYKLRTMHCSAGERGSAITAAADPRVFPFGALLRRLKIDELPQLFNVLRGEMSLVGPRPEDPEMLRRDPSRERLETLRVPPGLTSPGTLFDYSHGDSILGTENAERRYFEELLPLKVALDLVYVRNATWMYDAELICRTIWMIIAVGFGRRSFALPREFEIARPSAAASRRADGRPSALTIAES
jgi:lipopolysaccharide/colanic/teichoic acid biosynthesis glycosyltransferase